MWISSVVLIGLIAATAAVLFVPGDMGGRWVLSSVRRTTLVWVCAGVLFVVAMLDEWRAMTRYGERLRADLGHADKLDTQRFKFHAERNFYMHSFIVFIICVIVRLAYMQPHPPPVRNT